jgi:hypothetical protein
MRKRITSLLFFLIAVPVFSMPLMAQVYYPGFRSDAQKKAEEESKSTLKYDPHDFSGIWRGQAKVEQLKDPRIGDARPTPLMGGAPPPPMTAWGQKVFNGNKPSATESWQSRRVPPALGNDPLGHCDPLGYPRNLGGTFEILQRPDKILQLFEEGRRIREIYTDGRTIPDDVDPRFYGWAVGHWEGDTLIVDSEGYDGRTWLDGNGFPHSEDMKLHEVYRHPDAMTLEITMTLDDPKAYTKPWVGNKQTYHLALPKGLTVMNEYYCVPAEEEAFNRGVRNPAGGDLAHSRPLK